MKYWIPVLILLCAVASATAIAVPEQDSPAEAPVEQSAGDVAESPQSIEQVIDDETQTLAFVKAFDSEQQTLAKAEIATARELSEKGLAEDATARVESAQERVQKIRALYDEVLVHYPKNAELRNAYGELLYDVFGNVPLGVKEWKTALSMDPDLSAAHNNLGIHYAHYGEYALSLDHMDKALKLDGDNPDYLFNMVQVYLAHAPQVAKLRKWSEKRLYRKAMDYSEKAARLAPDDYELQQDYAVNFFAAENFEVEADWKDAAKAWQGARARTQRPDQVFYTWLNEGRVWLRAGKPDLARSALEQAVALRPESEVAQSLLQKTDGSPGTDDASDSPVSEEEQ